MEEFRAHVLEFRALREQVDRLSEKVTEEDQPGYRTRVEEGLSALRTSIQAVHDQQAAQGIKIEAQSTALNCPRGQ